MTLLTTCRFELLNVLARHRVSVYINDGALRARYPKTNLGLIWPLLAELKKQQDAIRDYLLALDTRNGPLALHPARGPCLEAGHCCWLTQTDCNLYPIIEPTDGGAVLLGLCRERRGR